MKPANSLPASLKTRLFKKIYKTGATPLFHARGAARMDYALWRPRRPAGGCLVAPLAPSPLSFSFFLFLSLFISLSFSLFFFRFGSTCLCRFGMVRNRTKPYCRSAVLVQHTLAIRQLYIAVEENLRGSRYLSILRISLQIEHLKMDSSRMGDNKSLKHKDESTHSCNRMPMLQTQW